ncbi:MAG TPA: sulfite exporter TauE/SafE family protein [Ohtaekwangia sp.]
MITIFSFQLDWLDLLAISGVAVLVGMSKTGVHGAGMMAVPMLASVFGGQASSGLLLPALCLADIIGVWYYHRHASWYHLRRLLPWAAAGTVAGTIVGGMIDDDLFKMIMGSVIIASIVLMIWLERGHKGDIPDNLWFSSVMGIIAGFTSMVGNLAGSITAVYFLSMRLPKNSFIGTTAWFFLIINLFKVPFHVFGWHTITLNSFSLNLAMLPAIAVGAVIGIWIVKKLEEKTYRWFIISMTLLAAIMMLF